MAQEQKQCPKVSDLIESHQKANKSFFSFEYYPPKTDKGVIGLKKRLLAMGEWGPQWMDVTWGAGGTTSDLTPEIADHIQNKAGKPCLMHLTCTNMPRSKIDEALQKAKELNVRNILALRGDPPHGETEWKAIDTGFSCALDLVKYIRANHGDYFCIVVAAYPEGHPNVRKTISDKAWNPKSNKPFYWAPRQLDDGSWEGVSAEDWKAEMNYLLSKIKAGANAIITQLFYDYDTFTDWIGQCRELGINVPIMPGIMPVGNYGGFKRMTGFCKTVIPPQLSEQLDAVKEKPLEVISVGMDWVFKMCQRLLDNKVVPGLHLYTMNSELRTAQILLHFGFGNDLKAIQAIATDLEAKERAKHTPSSTSVQPMVTF